MSRSTLFFAIAAVLAACSVPDNGTRTAHDLPDEPAAKPAAGSTETVSDATRLADRMRALDKTVYKVNVDGLPAIGSASAPLTIVFFSDYECPFCRKLEPQIDQLRADHGSDVRIVLAPRPLPFHERARPAALALIAASEQGKVEPMHRALFALEGKLDDEALIGAAREVGLDLQRFDADRKSAKAEATLTKADDLAKRFSVNGTPTTFVNGRRITGAVPDLVHELGEEQLAVGRGLLQRGTPALKVYDTIVADGLEKAGVDPAVSMGPSLTGSEVAEMAKCWADGAKPKSIQLSISADGKVTHVVTEPADKAECITKLSSTWALNKVEHDMTMKLVF